MSGGTAGRCSPEPQIIQIGQHRFNVASSATSSARPDSPPAAAVCPPLYTSNSGRRTYLDTRLPAPSDHAPHSFPSTTLFETTERCPPLLILVEAQVATHLGARYRTHYSLLLLLPVCSFCASLMLSYDCLHSCRNRLGWLRLS
jgi:hypothetical protein